MIGNDIKVSHKIRNNGYFSIEKKDINDGKKPLFTNKEKQMFLVSIRMSLLTWKIVELCSKYI